MNLVQLTNRLRQECQVSGIQNLATVQNATGQTLDMVNWINNAWNDIQEQKTDWKFMRTSTSFNTNTVTPQQSYTPTNVGIASTFCNYKKDSWRIYSTSLGFSNEMILPWIEYDEFRNLWMYGTQRTNYQRPVMFTIDPQKNFLLGGTPDISGYTCDGEFFTLPVPLVADADIPALPSQFHMLIVYEAMKHYGLAESAPEVIARGTLEADKMMARLTIDQLPTLGFGLPLC